MWSPAQVIGRYFIRFLRQQLYRSTPARPPAMEGLCF
jgi:hypothetical protein